MSLESTRRKLPPLTAEWFQMAMTPRHREDGTRLYVLTPPRREASTWGYVLAFVLITAAVGWWLLWVGSR